MRASSSGQPLHPGGEGRLIGCAGGVGGLNGAVDGLVECGRVHSHSCCIRSML